MGAARHSLRAVGNASMHEICGAANGLRQTHLEHVRDNVLETIKVTTISFTLAVTLVVEGVDDKTRARKRAGDVLVPPAVLSHTMD